MKSKNGSNSMLPDYRSTGDIVLKNQNTLRKLIGIVEAFGVAWTVKGELVLADKNTQLFLPLVSPYIFM